MFPAKRPFKPIASAIIKLAIAVGQANKIKIIPKSPLTNPSSYAAIVAVKGTTTILIKVEVKAKPEIF